MTQVKKLAKSYDYVLVGYNFSSLIFAHQLRRQNHSFCIIDSARQSNHPMKRIPALDRDVFVKIPYCQYEESLTEQLGNSPSLKTLADNIKIQPGTADDF